MADSTNSHILEEDDSRPESKEEGNAEVITRANDIRLKGNKLFGDGKYEEALQEYDQALDVVKGQSCCTEIISICHANRATCFYKLRKFEDTVNESTEALKLNPSYMKALLRRASAHENLKNFEEAILDMRNVVELDPSNKDAIRTICRLEPLAEEKKEKMKEEMIGKLKEMGNTLLGKFGMSMDNFKTVKDPNTGSYSVSFKQ